MITTASALVNRLLARGKFRHVQILLHLAELGSIQRAASAIGMTQSSVTQTLAYLEDLLEVQLFERHARGVRPTAACRDLLPVAHQLMLGVVDGAEVIAARRRQGEGTVRVIGSAAAINGLLVSALPDFCDEHPAIQIQLREVEGEDQLLAITRGEVDLVVCRQPAVMPEGWDFHPVREDHLVVVCRSSHPLARARSVSTAQLARETWLLLPAGLAARIQFDLFSATFPDFPAVYPVVTRSIQLLWRLLLARSLLALLPRNLATPLIASGDLVELRIGHAVAMKPIGLLQPHESIGEATLRLSTYLLSCTTPSQSERRQAGARSGARG